jgi:hypothetical protein
MKKKGQTRHSSTYVLKHFRARTPLLHVLCTHLLATTTKAADNGTTDLNRKRCLRACVRSSYLFACHGARLVPLAAGTVCSVDARVR